MDQLEKALDAAEGARTLVIKGAGERAFISGGDLKKLSAIRTVEGSICHGLADAIDLRPARSFPAPVVAALNGHAFGGGAEVAVAADIRLAADDIKIAFNQVALEIIPPWGGAERLAALLGKSKALLLAGTGAVLEAAEAERIGLVDRVLPRASFDEGWRSIAKALASRPAGEIKRVMARRRHRRGGRSFRAAVGLRRALGRRGESDEPRQVAPRATVSARNTPRDCVKRCRSRGAVMIEQSDPDDDARRSLRLARQVDRRRAPRRGRCPCRRWANGSRRPSTIASSVPYQSCGMRPAAELDRDALVGRRGAVEGVAGVPAARGEDPAP